MLLFVVSYQQTKETLQFAERLEATSAADAKAVREALNVIRGVVVAERQEASSSRESEETRMGRLEAMLQRCTDASSKLYMCFFFFR